MWPEGQAQRRTWGELRDAPVLKALEGGVAREGSPGPAAAGLGGQGGSCPPHVGLLSRIGSVGKGGPRKNHWGSGQPSRFSELKSTDFLPPPLLHPIPGKISPPSIAIASSHYPTGSSLWRARALRNLSGSLGHGKRERTTLASLSRQDRVASASTGRSTGFLNSGLFTESHQSRGFGRSLKVSLNVTLLPPSEEPDSS